MVNIKSAPSRTISPYAPTPTAPIKWNHPFPPDLWALAKQIDELGGEWTFPIFHWRASNFHFFGQPVGFYEPMANFERLTLEAYLSQRAQALCPRGDDTASLGIVLQVFPSIYDASDGTISIPSDEESKIGQHYFRVLGIQDEDTLVVHHRWSGWNETGIGYISREYFDRYATEAWIYRRWDRGPKASTVEQLLATSDSPEFSKLWLEGRKRGSITKIAGEQQLSLRWFECWSMHDERPAEVLTLHLARNLRVGVAVLIHPTSEDPQISMLSDIFIWPTYRRKHYGIILERFAAERSRLHGSTRLGTYTYNSDTVNGNDRPISFMAACGYEDIDAYQEGQVALYAERSIAES